MECKICGMSFKCISATHLQIHKITMKEYKEKYKVDRTVDLKVAEKISKSTKGKINIGDKNGARRPEVREKIANTIKERWSSGVYTDRINGMLNKTGKLHHNYKPENHTVLYLAEKQYVKFLSSFQDISHCSRCGSGEKKINIHHIDEDHRNFLPSNLEPLCVPCHSAYHYSNQKHGYCTITKIFTFAAAHNLPQHPGKCFNLHGHEWRLDISIKKRIDPITGMVMDFGDLKQVVGLNVIDVLDHSYINNIIETPTAENIVVWIWEKLMFDGRLKGISSIKLWETSTSFSELTVAGMLSTFSTNVEEYVQDDSYEVEGC